MYNYFHPKDRWAYEKDKGGILPMRKSTEKRFHVIVAPKSRKIQIKAEENITFTQTVNHAVYGLESLKTGVVHKCQEKLILFAEKMSAKFPRIAVFYVPPNKDKGHKEMTGIDHYYTIEDFYKANPQIHSEV